MEKLRRSRRDERTEGTRRELIESGTKVLAEPGFHEGYLERVPSEAGYTIGAIYWHFGSKDELFLAAFESYALKRVAEINQVYEQAEGELPQRARALADHWMARQAADPSFLIVALEFFVHSLRHPHLREALATRQAAVRLALGRILEQETRAAGAQSPIPAEDVALVMRELGVGMAQAKLLDPDAFPESLFGDFVELFYELLLSNPRRGAPEAMEESS